LSRLYPQTDVAGCCEIFLRRSPKHHIGFYLLNVRSYSFLIFRLFPYSAVETAYVSLVTFEDPTECDVFQLNYTDGISVENHNIDTFISLKFCHYINL
jgi:hypothetical protein